MNRPLITPKEKPIEKSIWDKFKERSGWFWTMSGGFGIIFLGMAIAGFAISILAFGRTTFFLEQTNYYRSSTMSSTPLSHVMFGGTAVILTLPSDLSDYVGKLYHVDCGSAAAHQVVIAPGYIRRKNFFLLKRGETKGLAAWTGGGARTATCTAQGGGFSFRVISPSGVRLIDPRNVVFT